MGKTNTVVYRSRTWNSGTFAWWGGETIFTLDQMGSRYPASADLDIESQYRTNGVWWSTNGSAQVCIMYFATGTTFPTWYKCSYGGASNELQRVRTNDH